MIAELLPESESESPEKPPRRVLVIDDDRTQVETLQYRLERLGYKVRAAHTGRQGLSAVQETVPDVVLLDLRLPDCEGFDVCSRLSDSPVTCGIPIIIVSGMDRSDVVRRARSAGSEYFLSKPYDPNVLLMLIESVLGDETSSAWE